MCFIVSGLANVSISLCVRLGSSASTSWHLQMVEYCNVRRGRERDEDALHVPPGPPYHSH